MYIEKTHKSLNSIFCVRLQLGCPRNNQFYFRFEPKQTETQTVSVVFRFVSRNQKTFFRFVPVRFGVSDQYRNNQNKQTFVETNQKNLQKTFSFRGSSKQLNFSRFEPKQTETQSVSVIFRFVFSRKQK
jgi:hypothetical protein